MKRWWPEVLLVAAAIYQLVLIVSFSVNFPYADEWELIVPDVLRNPSWKWLWAFHNEHRILFSRLWSIGWFRVSGLHITGGLVLNFFLYCASVGLIYALKVKTLGWHRFQTFALFLLPFFSTLPIQNNMWFFQSCFHFSSLATLGMVLLLFTPGDARNAWLTFFSASALIFFNIFSTAQGLPLSLGLILCYLTWTLWKNPARWPMAVGLVVVWGAISAIWFVDYPPRIGGYFGPHRWEFWFFWLQTVGKVLGATDHRKAVLAALLCLVLLGLYLRVLRQRRVEWQIHLPWMALAFSVFAGLAAVTLGRAHHNLYSALEPRYFSMSGLLLPVLALAAWTVAQETRRPQRTKLIFAFFLLLTYSGYFGWQGYEREFRVKAAGLDCVQTHFAIPNDPVECPQVYPGPLRERLEYARELQLSFMKSLPGGS